MLRPADIDPNLSADARIDGLRLPPPPALRSGPLAKKQTMELRTDPPPVML